LRRKQEFSTRERLKSRTGFRTVGSLQVSYLRIVLFAGRQWRRPMRAVSCMIAVILVLTAPSLAGSADGDLPGVGTFSYCGTPILAPAPEVVAALGH
jgi:hypothetical protein